MTVRVVRGPVEPEPPYRGFERACECGGVMRQHHYDPERLVCGACGRGWSAPRLAFDLARERGEVVYVRDE